MKKVVKKEVKDVYLTCRIPKSLKNRIRAYAHHEGRTESNFVAQIIKEAVNILDLKQQNGDI